MTKNRSASDQVAGTGRGPADRGMECRPARAEFDSSVDGIALHDVPGGAPAADCKPIDAVARSGGCTADQVVRCVNDLESATDKIALDHIALDHIVRSLIPRDAH